MIMEHNQPFHPIKLTINNKDALANTQDRNKEDITNVTA